MWAEVAIFGHLRFFVNSLEICVFFERSQFQANLQTVDLQKPDLPDSPDTTRWTNFGGDSGGAPPSLGGGSAWACVGSVLELLVVTLDPGNRSNGVNTMVIWEPWRLWGPIAPISF